MKVNYTFSAFAVFITLFPWVSFSLNSMDSQPWQYVGAVGYFIAKSRDIRVPNNIRFYLACVFLGLIVGFLINGLNFNFNVIRGLGNYFGIFLIYVLIFDFSKRYGFPKNIILFVNFIWLFCGLIEHYALYDFSGLVNSRTSIGRGVTSLATEPTFFAIQLFFFSFIYLVTNDYKLNKTELFIVTLNVLSIVFVAKSAMGILFLVISFLMICFYLLIKNVRLFLGCFCLAIAIFGIFSSVQFTGASRVVGLLESFSNGGIMALAYTDASINGRLQDIILPGYYFWYNFGLPAGFNAYGNAESKLVTLLWDGFFWYQVGGDTVMSYVMSMAVELGIFGVFGYVALAMAHRDLSLKKCLEHFTIFVILLSAIPLANALPIYLFVALLIRPVSCQKV